MKINSPSHLSDTQLEAEVKRLARCEREATVHLIAHLMEFDARQLYLSAGFSSLFVYCCEVLRLSEHETYNRIEVARAARRFPVILDLLANGALNQTTVRLLAPHLAAGDGQELLAAAAHKSKRQVEELLAGMFPRPAVPSSVRKLPTSKAPPPLPTKSAAQLAPFPEVPAELAPLPEVPPEPVADLPALLPAAPRSAPDAEPPARRSVVRPLAPDRYEIRFTASAETREKLRLAQDLLRHAIPTGDTAEVIDRALTLLLDDLARKKFAATDRPRASTGPAAGSRHVGAKVQRAVWLRDGGRCVFVGKRGRRCNERAFLEFHHVDPHVLGGEASVDGSELRCRAHNAYEARLYFGPRPGGSENRVKEPRASYEASPDRGLVPERVIPNWTPRLPGPTNRQENDSGGRERFELGCVENARHARHRCSQAPRHQSLLSGCGTSS